ncbi:MAG TPA: glutaredoxin family protein [Rhodocyclaceae bacterium]|nr:glutaredoxin family protein [Rhodocyclaceae bacterium]
MMPVLTLYGHAWCHLCAEMADQLSRLSSELNFELRNVDIDQDMELAGRYGEHIPVLCFGDDEICRHRLDLDAIGRLKARIGKNQPCPVGHS